MHVLARVVIHVLSHVLLHVLAPFSTILARVVIHVLARVLLHVLAGARTWQSISCPCVLWNHTQTFWENLYKKSVVGWTWTIIHFWRKKSVPGFWKHVLLNNFIIFLFLDNFCIEWPTPVVLKVIPPVRNGFAPQRILWFSCFYTLPLFIRNRRNNKIP